MARRRLSKRRIAALVVGLLAAAVAALPLYTVFFGTPQKISSLDLATPSTATRGSVATELRVARGPSEVGIERRKPTFETKDTEFIENTDHLVAGHQEPRPSDGSDESTTQTQTEEASSKKKRSRKSTTRPPTSRARRTRFPMTGPFSPHSSATGSTSSC
tara:strand:- start:1182 stop:1661 length:480 start_codon:yes stop_codon:yes gene_type:complete